MNTPLPVRVLVLGHSYVRRLRDYLVATDQVNFNLAMAGHSVKLYGLGGMTFPTLLQRLHSACSPGYDLAILDFGTNDIADGCDVDLLVDKAIAVAETLTTDYDVKQVVFMEIFPRKFGRYRTPRLFNQNARAYNVRMRARVQDLPRIHVHHHQGMVANCNQYLHDDGVHMNSIGMGKYAKSVRRAILRYSSRHLIRRRY